MKILSLRVKLILPIFFLMAVIFCVAQWFSYQKDLYQNEKRFVERVRVLAQGVSYNLKAAILFDDPHTAEEILSAFEVDEDIVKAKLYTKENQLFASYVKPENDVHTSVERDLNLMVDSGYVIFEQYMYMHVPVEIEGEFIASLRITTSTRSFLDIYNTALTEGAYFISLLFLCGFILYLLVQKMIVNPVYLLNSAMKGFIENGQSKPDLLCKSKDEIGDLVIAFNLMLERIENHENDIVITLDKLESEKAFVNEVLDTVQHALLVVEPQGNIILSNEIASRLFNISITQLFGTNLKQLIHTDRMLVIERALTTELDDELLAVNSGNDISKQKIFKITTRMLSRHDQILFAIEDVTDVEMALSRQRLAAGIFENSKDGLVLLDSKGKITMINPAVTQLLGYSSEMLVNKPIDKVLIWRQFSSLLPVIKQNLDHFGQWQGEVWEQHLEGDLVPLFAKVTSIPIPDFPYKYDMVIMLSDLSNVKEMERLEYMAHHDALTGLANRTQLYRVLNDVIADSYKSGTPFSLLYLDLDGFKQVNDTYGHAAGDEVLKQVSQRLLSQVRNQDLVARLSGDEFVVLITSSDRSSVRIMSERLIKLIEHDIIYKKQKLNVGASIGVYFAENVNADIDTMLKTADSAMYKAKSLGKGQFVLIDNSI